MNRDEAQEALTAGIEAMTTSEDWVRYLDFQRRFHRYSFGNVILIARQRPDATNVAGFGRWLEMGRAVRKGEKGIAILAPMVGKRKPEAGEAEDADAGPRVVYGYRVAYVFDVTQTDGDSLPAAPVPVQMGGEGPVGVGEALGHVTRSLGYTIRVVPASDIHGAHGMCEFTTKRISLAEGLAPAGALKTLVHELAHAHLHGTGVIDRPTAELEAESVAYCVCAELGLDTGQYSFAYVTGWSGKDAVASVKAAGTRIQHATAAILDGIAAYRPMVTA